MKVPIKLWLIEGSVVSLMLHYLVAVGWGLYTQSLTQATALAIGATLGVSLVWALYGAALACLWLRRKQLEGDGI